MNATKHSGRTKPMPTERARLEIEATIEADAFEMISRGYIPQEHQDKWFIYLSDDGWLNFHRAQTGTHVYAAKFEVAVDNTFTITEAWVNRNSAEYKMKDLAYDARVLVYLMRKLLLKHNVHFPTPAAMPHKNKPLHEKHVIGDSRDGGSFIPLDLMNNDL